MSGKSKYERQTAESKGSLALTFSKMANACEWWKNYCEHIPELNDKEHAERVRKFAEDMRSLNERLITLVNNARFS